MQAVKLFCGVYSKNRKRKQVLGTPMGGTLLFKGGGVEPGRRQKRGGGGCFVTNVPFFSERAQNVLKVKYKKLVWLR